MIKQIISWFTDNKKSGARTFNLSVELMQASIEYELIREIQREIVIKVADKFIETHDAELKSATCLTIPISPMRSITQSYLRKLIRFNH